MSKSEEDKKKERNEYKRKYNIRPHKKDWYLSDEEKAQEENQEFLEGLVDKGFKVIKLEPPKGGLCYMKRIKFLNDPAYSDLPQFITARGTENGVSIFNSEFEGGAFIKELPTTEFDKVFEID